MKNITFYISDWNNEINIVIQCTICKKHLTLHENEIDRNVIHKCHQTHEIIVITEDVMLDMLHG